MISRPMIAARRGRLIGRAGELAALRDLILHGDGRLVTMTGPGGSGKTTLALEAARLLEDAMPDGAALIDLLAVREADAITLACCEALGLIEQDRSPFTVLADFLAPRQLLLVLDNCEHLAADVAALVDRLLDACPDLRVIATSRSLLRVRGESVFAVQPLAVPSLDHGAGADELGRVPAVELFVERATAANPAFEFADSARAVAAICRQLDGLPLAIELAAAQAAALTPAEIEERLGGASSGGQSGHQRTVDATIDWSHELLGEAERVLFRRLSVFEDGWTLDGAERVCSLGAEPSSVTTTLVSLVDQSLVVRVGDGSASRFRMLAPIAEYATRRLAASDDLMPASLAHAQYYLELIGTDAKDWREIEPEQLDLIATEYGNCQAAMRFAERARIVPLVLGFAVSLLLFWRVRGLLRSGTRRLEAALALLDEAPSRERGLVLAGLAHHGQLLGELDAADERAAEAESVLMAADDPVAARTVIGFRGDIAADRGDFDEALAHYARARALVDADLDTLDLAFWHANVGRTATRRGDLVSAERELEQARVHLRSASGWYQGHVLVQLGSLARRRGDLDRAALILGEALGHLHPYGAVLEGISCLDELARLALDSGHHERAATLFAAATAARDTVAVPIPEHARAGHAQDVERLRSSMALTSFSAAWERGRRLSLAKAGELAAESHVPTTDASLPPRPVLTPREREIAQLVSLGLTNRMIAEQLVIATGTVRIHVERILGKLGLTSRVQIATWVVAEAEGADERVSPAR